MVKKLLKHELLSYLHTLPIVYIVVLGVGLMGRIARAFEADNIAYELLRNSADIMLMLASYAAMVLTTIFCLLRFYKNLFSGEGYLTLTLPVSVEQHLLVKTIGALIANVATALTIFASVCIFFAGDWFTEITKALLYLYKKGVATYGGADMAMYVLEILLTLLTLTLMQYMTFYVCICIGQTLRRGRIIAAIGIYYGLTQLTQIIGTIIVIIISVYGNVPLLIAITDLIRANIPTFVHLLLWGIIVMGMVWSGICFLVSRKTMKHKLNLR